MERNLTLKMLGLVVLVLELSSGCAKYKKSTDITNSDSNLTDNRNTQLPDTPGTTDPLNPVTGPWTTGATATFTPVSSEVFNDWVAGHPVEPQNALINVNFKKTSGKLTYTGSVKLRYQSGSSFYEANLKTHTDTYNGTDYYRYNYWFNSGSKKVFSGFVEDKIGGVVLVIDDTLDLGDGAGATNLSGELWFKNFGASWASYYEGAAWSVVLPCWFRSIGPYDCRSNNVLTKSSLYPSDTYSKLGTFENLNQLKAFID